MSELYLMVLRLREDDDFSRNRHFDELSQPLARRARRIDKRLRGIEREVRAGAVVALAPLPQGYRLELSFPAVRTRREAYLTVEEHALLCRDPGIAAMLALHRGARG